MKHRSLDSNSSALGKLFVFEGADNVGKTTLARELATHLSQNGVQCLYTSFPGRELGTLGQLVYQVHHYQQVGEIAAVNPTALQLLHIAAHIDSIENRILPALVSGQCVVLDRYWWSTWAYGCISGSNEESLLEMIRLEQKHWQGVKPEIVFHIHREIPLGSPLIEEELKTWKRWRREYQKLAHEQRENCPIVDIPNDGAFDVTLRALLDAISLNSPV